MAAGSHENLGTQSSQFYPSSGRSQRPLFFAAMPRIKERELQTGGLT